MLFVAVLIMTVVLMIMIFAHYMDFLLSGYRHNQHEDSSLLIMLLVTFLKIIPLIAVIVGGMVWLSQPRFVQKKTVTKHDYYRGIRSHFVLPYDYPYGDFIIPKGSLIDRPGTYSSGEEIRPLQMNRLKSVRFPYPVKIAGVKANALLTWPLAVELAEDVVIGPVYDEDSFKVADEQACQKGDLAEYYQPRLKEKTHKMITTSALEKVNAVYFVPDQWLFLGCDSDSMINVPLPYSKKIGDPIVKGGSSL